jgi:transcriptional regulator with XRE-family HTH domain
VETERPRKRRYGEVLRGLQRVRGRAGMSQQELAEKAGVERATISNLENRKRAAQPPTISKLAEALGVDEEDLISAPKDDLTLFPTDPEGRSVVYLNALRKLLDRFDRRLEDAIENGEVDMVLAELVAHFERDLWERVVPEIRLMHGIGGMPKEEADAHEKLYATLLGFGAAVHEAYDAAVRNIRGPRSNVVGRDRLQAAMEERKRAQTEGKERIEEAARSA